MGASVPNFVSKIVAIDGQPLLRWALKQLISNADDLQFAGEASTVQDALEIVERLKPDLVILGLDYSDGTGFGLIKDLRVRYPDLRTLVYATQEGNAYAEHCLGLGARGYVSSSQTTAEIVAAIRQVLGNELYLRDDRHNAILSRLMSSGRDVAKPLTERLSASEFEVFHLVGSGLANQEIASKLHRSIKTVETYRARIKEKLGVGSSIELAQFALRCLNATHGTPTDAVHAPAPVTPAVSNPAPGQAPTPITDAPAIPLPASFEGSAVKSSIRTVLIVDDHSISRDPLAIILRQNGFKTECAKDGQEAIDRIIEHDPHLVLLDLLMPQVNGIRVLQFIRDTPRYRDLPVIVMTALTGGEMIDRARQLNATIVFKAETRIDELLTAISRGIYGDVPKVA